MALQKRLLPLGQRGPVRRPARERPPHREQRGLGLDPAQDHPQVVEVHLGLGRRRMGLRHAALLGRLTDLGSDLRSTFAHVVAHRRIRQIGSSTLVDQPRENAAGSVPLLLRSVQIAAQHVVNRPLERLQPRRGPGRRLPRRRDRARQRLPHPAPVHVILLGQLANRALLNPRVASDRGKQLHPRPHHLRPPP